MTFSDILLKSFSKNLKKLTEITKTNHFSIFFLHFPQKSYDFELLSSQI